MLDKLNALLDAIPGGFVIWKLSALFAITFAALAFGVLYSYFGKEEEKRSEESSWLTLIAVVILGSLVGVFITSSVGAANNDRLNTEAQLSTNPLIYALLADELSYDPAIMKVDLAFTPASPHRDLEQLPLFSRSASDLKNGIVTQSIKLESGPSYGLLGRILDDSSDEPSDEPSVKIPTQDSSRMLTWARQLAAEERPQVLVTYSNSQQAKLEATVDQNSKLVLVAPQGVNISTVRVPVDPR